MNNQGESRETQGTGAGSDNTGVTAFMQLAWDANAKPTLRRVRNAAEIFAIRKALEQTGWNRRGAAKLLSISYRGLLYKIRQHNIIPAGSVQVAELPAKTE
ncbi:MAG TPA: helix-turn-helix domain-containing protein [Dongiaceae bacterium]|nr:helix-turn-helix domain-containing protein [Dongiaceae bacterium]